MRAGTDPQAINGAHPVGPANHSNSRDEEAITARVAEIAEGRAVIEQAKGMLMFVYGIDADEAFQLLRWQSQHHNVKLRVLAGQLTQDFSAASRQQPPVDRLAYDNLILTAYTRVEPSLLPVDVADMLKPVRD